MSFFQKKFFYFFLLSITTTLPNHERQDIFREFAKTRAFFEAEISTLSIKNVNPKILTLYIDETLKRIYTDLYLYLEQAKHANENEKPKLQTKINNAIESYDWLIFKSNSEICGLGAFVEKRLMHLISLESQALFDTLHKVKEIKPYCHLNAAHIFVKVKMINVSMDSLIFKNAKL